MVVYCTSLLYVFIPYAHRIYLGPLVDFSVSQWDWIGLYLFNDDTCPPGHISCPSQVEFVHSCLRSMNEFLWWCSVVGIDSTWYCHQLVTDLNDKLYWIYGHSYRIIEPSFSQKFFYASLWVRLKEGLQWVNCVVLITTFFCNTVHSRGMCSIVRVWPQCWKAVGGPRDKILDFLALVWLIRSRSRVIASAETGSFTVGTATSKMCRHCWPACLAKWSTTVEGY